MIGLSPGMKFLNEGKRWVIVNLWTNKWLGCAKLRSLIHESFFFVEICPKFKMVSQTKWGSEISQKSPFNCGETSHILRGYAYKYFFGTPRYENLEGVFEREPLSCFSPPKYQKRVQKWYSTSTKSWAVWTNESNLTLQHFRYSTNFKSI